MNTSEIVSENASKSSANRTILIGDIANLPNSSPARETLETGKTLFPTTLPETTRRDPNL